MYVYPNGGVIMKRPIFQNGSRNIIYDGRITRARFRNNVLDSLLPSFAPAVGFVLGTPASLSAAIDETSGGILLTASEVTGADSYTYYYSVDGAAYTEAATGQDTTYTFTPTQAGSYSFGVTAVKGSSESAMTTLTPSGLFTDVPDSEGIALMAFAEATGWEAWTDNTNWMTDSTVGNWFGVTVSGGHVTDIDLVSNNLSGAVGTTLDGLSLTALDLTGNILTGKILIADPGTYRMETEDGAAAIYASENDLSGYTSHLIRAIDSSGNEAEAYGYQAEDTITNLLPYSNDFTSWGVVSGVILAAATAPDGSNDAHSVIANTDFIRHRIYEFLDLDQVDAYTFSIYIKAGESADCLFDLNANSDPDAGVSVIVDLNAETVAIEDNRVNTTGVSVDLVSYSNGWYRVSISTTQLNTTNAGDLGPMIYPTGSDNTEAGDGESRVYLWGAQLEQGTKPHLLVDTDGASASITTALQLRSTSDGTTRNLTSKDAGFDPNNIATIEIECLTAPQFADIEPDESYALEAFYTATGGDAWTDNTGWDGNTAGDCFGVTVVDNHVTEINLNNNGLSGDISDITLAELTGLVLLDLDGNASLTDSGDYDDTISDLRISAVDGTAFLDACAAITGYADGAHQVRVFDSSNRLLTGVLAAQGSGETLGSELVTDGSFDEPCGVNWDCGAGWTISGGTANCDTESSPQIIQSGSYTAKALYKAAFFIPSYTSGRVRFNFGAGNTTALASATGAYSYNKTIQSNNIVVQAYIGFVGSVDDVSIKQILTPSTSGATIADDTLTAQHSSFVFNESSYRVQVKAL